jgi:hypothetical protein
MHRTANALRSTQSLPENFRKLERNSPKIEGGTFPCETRFQNRVPVPALLRLCQFKRFWEEYGERGVLGPATE